MVLGINSYRLYITPSICYRQKNVSHFFFLFLQTNKIAICGAFFLLNFSIKLEFGGNFGKKWRPRSVAKTWSSDLYSAQFLDSKLKHRVINIIQIVVNCLLIFKIYLQICRWSVFIGIIPLPEYRSTMLFANYFSTFNY